MGRHCAGHRAPGVSRTEGEGEGTDGKQTQFPNTDLFASAQCCSEKAHVRAQNRVEEGLTWSGGQGRSEGE